LKFSDDILQFFARFVYERARKRLASRLRVYPHVHIPPLYLALLYTAQI